jgi:CarD family transcriptional regulator
MAARKKASKKGSGTVTKKTKAPAGSTTPHKRKASAASASQRTAKAKNARSAKVKTDKAAEAKRRAARAAAKRRARSAGAAQAEKPANAKSAKPAATKPTVNEAAKPAMVKPVVAKPSVEAKAEPHVAAQAPRPAAAPAPAKPAAPLAKRAPFPVKGRVVDVAAAIDTDVARPGKSASGPRAGFKVSEFVVYPAHGVGQIVAVEDQEVAGFRLELFVINFAKDKMTLRVPTSKVVGVGMRKLSDPDVAKRSLEILTGRARVKRTMWSRRAQEYEAKINSGDINAIAEVVRDLYRSEAQPEQSYSERQLYEAALDRIMREIAAVQKLSEIDALKLIESHLKRSQRRAAKAEASEGEDAVEEAA